VWYIARTGSKMGISPLMLAAMNGHTAAVKLLLDMGSDINAQVPVSACLTVFFLLHFLIHSCVISLLSIGSKCNHVQEQ